MRTSIVKNQIANIPAKTINHPMPIPMSHSHVIMLWDDENDDFQGMVMSTASNKEKWKTKIGRKREFVDIEINRNILIEDEYWREGILSM